MAPRGPSSRDRGWTCNGTGTHVKPPSPPKQQHGEQEESSAESEPPEDDIEDLGEGAAYGGTSWNGGGGELANAISGLAGDLLFGAFAE